MTLVLVADGKEDVVFNDHDVMPEMMEKMVISNLQTCQDTCHV